MTTSLDTLRAGAVALGALLLAGCGGEAGPWTSRELATPAPPGALYPALAAAGGDGIWLSWLEEPPDGPTSIQIARYDGDGWSGPFSVHEGDGILVNWADFPAPAVLGDGTLAMQWRVEAPIGEFGYGARIAFSADGGRTWSEPRRIHDDGDGGAEHGFVSTLPAGRSGLGTAWLDGRSLARGGGMELRYRLWERGTPGAERVLDDDVCTCCNTAAAHLGDRSWIAYRDHTAGEVRDIRVVEIASGVSTSVSADGWTLAACPVNGPGLAVAGDRLAAIWYTEAPPAPRVLVAFSTDAGLSFGEPLRVDDGAPVGRVDIAALQTGEMVAVWMERVAAGAEVRWRRIAADGTLRASQTAGPTKLERSAGFPRAVAAGDAVYLVWRRPPHPWELALVRLGR